ncbi:MAG: DUF308 domain-containing protein [Methanomicrobiales archaeon]|nr:DUF308 domain-containing protein [Methanomicrobiales archaeon]
MAQGRHVYQGNGLLLRGGVGIVFGLMAVVMPGILLNWGTAAIGLVLIFLSMMTAMIALATEPSDRGRKGTLLLFLLSLMAGGAMMVSTGLQDPMFFSGLAGWLFLSGISEISLAFSGDLQEYQGVIAVSSILNVAFGMILIVMDIRTPSPLMLTLGLFVFIFGIFSMLSGILVRLSPGVTFD